MQAVKASQAADVLERSRSHPGWFASNVLGVHWWSKQIEIAESVRDNERTTVKAANGVGKTFNAAGIALWFLLSFPRSRVVTTATTWPQVEKLLWHELGLLHRRARFPLGGQLNLTELKLPDGRYAIGLSTKPTELESFQGHHAPNLLLIYDEASGIPASVYEAGEGYMTARGARMLLIGNPTQAAGQFYDSHHGQRDHYSRFTIRWQDTPAFTGEECPQDVLDALPYPEKLEQRKQMWGENSPLYQVRVLGQFARTSTNTVVSLGDLEEAQARHLECDPAVDLIVIGADIARFGDDETVIAERIGQHIEFAHIYKGKRPPTATSDEGTEGDIVHTAALIAEVARKYPRVATRIVVDDTGVGGGVTDILRSQGHRVTAYNAGGQAHSPLDYPNRRSELWFQMAASLVDLDLPQDDQLAGDLLAPTYKFDSPRMRRVVETKAETKKRLRRSPDRADAVMLTLVPEQSPGAIALPARKAHGKRTQRDDLLSADDLMNQPM